MLIVSSVFEVLARAEAGGFCVPDLPVLVVDHPVAGRSAETLQEWGDGLPVLPPTPARVQAMLDAVDVPPDRSLGAMVASRRACTVHAVAVNAVMAGRRPEHFAVVPAAVDAVFDPAFNLYGIQATKNPVAPLVLINGPIVQRLGFNGGTNAPGPRQ